MSRVYFPSGWNEKRIQQVIEHYEEQSEDEALAEDEAGMGASETVMNVPHELLSEIRGLIAKRQR